LGTFNVLEAARKSGVKRVVFASSNAAAGQQSPPVNEMGVPRPASPYRASKLAAEGYCSAYSEAYGLETVALRFANAYGPHSTHKTSVIARFLSLALRNEPISIYGDGSQTRDFVYVEDLCRAIRLALDGEGVQSGVYQIGTGVETSVNDLVATLEEVLGKTLEKKSLPVRRGEVQRMFLDITKARTLLGYEPGVSLREGLEETCQWFISNTASPLREGS
jgi:UDP-glucose 4-epimerase